VDGGVFKGSYAIAGGVGTTLPVDLLISGCPPTPERILAGLRALLEANARSYAEISWRSTCGSAGATRDATHCATLMRGATSTCAWHSRRDALTTCDAPDSTSQRTRARR
jgi:NADH:ubiquinone oxidoreductase subunit B-like Fe-S oxidoreductase